uniref:Voltage-dependent calcium channel subunit alpha-2/delta-3 n=1 Tax=Cacopsylla melanoneura TaxID=428564 RepID=A0A8D8S0Y7_9HEMI
MKADIVLLVLILGLCAEQCVGALSNHIIDQKQVHSWAQRIGMELWGFATHVTQLEKLKENFTEARVETVDPEQLLGTIAKSIEDMMLNKISALKRIADTAEKAALSFTDDANLTNVKYWNANKDIAAMESYKDPNFYHLQVNTNRSVIHVPVNVYNETEDVLRVAEWSKALDPIFVRNYQDDPSLSWQYFGSTTGALRVFPANQWSHFQSKFEPPDVEPDSLIDLYDCRVREWYINAAASPKDMIILLDNSGSMMGQRREIARHVINDLLDTLGNNDYVNVLKFTQNATEVEPCFADILVQANLANIRTLKIGVEKVGDANNIANFSVAFKRAFQILELARINKTGADCNQAIMVVTDGASENYKEVFEEWNWRGQNDSTQWPVRVFTYLVGKEVADYRDVKWMACANKGYYVHLSTLAEVRDQILSYVPVMARPLVLQGKEHPIVWTPIYADVTDPKLSDWLWELKECDEQRYRSISYRNNATYFRTVDVKKREEQIKHRSYWQNSHNVSPYRLLTTVAMPAFDLKERIVPCYKVCAKHESFLPFKEPNIPKAFSAPKNEKMVTVANLLGVAGIDVPDTEFKRALLPHELGVNAYGFIVTNNGFILVHPDLRSMFQGILKPSYNSVDLTEIEQVDDDGGPRDYNKKLLEMRTQVVHQQKNSMELRVKYQLDNMRRISRGTKMFYYRGLKTDKDPSPFSLVLAIPQPLGRARVAQQEEIALLRKKFSVVDLFHNDWKVHPEWFYCKYNFHREDFNFTTAEAEVVQFVTLAMSSNWKWPPKTNIPPEKRYYKMYNFTCDRDLFLSLIYDAKQTMSFSTATDYSTTNSNDPRDKKEFAARFGLTIVFVATRSGLLRYKGSEAFKNDPNLNNTAYFAATNNRAIDEVWYKRAVEQHYVDENSFVFSVEFEAYGSKIFDTFNLNMKPRVTATHAIFVGNAEKKAPVAVVGLQMLHSALQNIFVNITSTSIYNKSKIETCLSDNLECFILDNNGYVIASENHNKASTGLFFGAVHPDVMRSMVKTNIYREIKYYDHQAVCFEVENVTDDTNSGRRLLTPLHHMSWVFKWTTIQMFWYLINLNLNMFGTLAYSFTDQDDEEDKNQVQIEDDDDILIEDEMEEEDYVNIKSEAYDDIMSADEPALSSSVPTYTEAPETIVEPSPSEMVRDIIKIHRTRPQPCDREVDLYVLEPKTLVLKDTQRSTMGMGHKQDCNRPYLLELIPNTNLVLVVINNHCYPKMTEPYFDTYPTKVEYPMGSMLCYKERSDVRLNRRRPTHCVRSHTKETNITQLCGRASNATLPNFLLVLSLFVFYLFPRL